MGEVSSLKLPLSRWLDYDAKELVFHGNDGMQHKLAYYPPNKKWLLSNMRTNPERPARIFPNLVSGLSGLETASGHHVDSFKVSTLLG